MTSSRRIFVSTACIGPTAPLQDRLDSYLEQGIDEVELGAGVLVEESELETLPKLAGHLIIHNYFPPPAEPFVINLASADDLIRQQSIALACRAIDLSNRLRAPFYSIHAGFITDPIGFGDTSFIFPLPASPQEEQDAVERFVASLQVLIEYGHAAGVRILVENNVCSEELKGKLLMQTADEFLAVFQRLASDDLGILVDTGHLNVTAHTLGFDRMEFIDQVAPYVQAFHLHDNDGNADQHLPVEAGSWILDIFRRQTFSALPVTIEAKFASIEDIQPYRRWLRQSL